jgi:predicted acetyltransferase
MIKLVIPTPELKEEILSFKKDFIDSGENIPGGELLDKINDFDEWLDYVTRNASEDSVSDDWVLTYTYLATHKGEVIGVICLRHYLNDFLKNFGHVGYSVRPSCRRRGVATYMLGSIIDVAKKIGLESIKVSAEKDNIASVKVIKKNGGQFIKEFKYVDRDVNLYLIELKDAITRK